MNEHQPYRPGWSCRTCRLQWPCEPARMTFREAYRHDPDGLTAHLLRLTGPAARDLGLPSEATLYHRFVGWTLHRDRTCRICGSRRHDVLPGLPPRLFPCSKVHQDLCQDTP